MKLQGSFNDIDNAHTYAVKVWNDDTHGTESYDVGEEGVYFEESPVTVETKCDSMEDTIIETKATVNLLTNALLSGIFSADAKDTKVEISCDGGLLFSGFVEPRAYTQAFDDETNGLSLNCIDGLTAMKYCPFKGVGSKGQFLDAKEKAGMASMKDLLLESIASGCGDMTVYYDGSKQPEKGSGLLFDRIMVNESLYLGDDPDSVKTYYDIASDLLHYLGLHAVETCAGVYVFSWESLGKDITWTQIGGTARDGAGYQWAGGTLSVDHIGGTDGSVDIGEVFNQVTLTVSPKTTDTVVRSPLDSSGTVPALGAKVTYMTEYAADGVGVKAARAFWSLVRKHEDNGYDGGQTWKDYMIRPMRNLYWNIGSGSGPESKAVDWAASASSPETLADKLRGNLGALLIGTGTVDHKPGAGDTSKQATVSMTTQLVVSVNGNDSDTSPQPTDGQIRAAMPVASYVGGDATAVYSPSDKNSRNYLVFAGTLTLCPLMKTQFRVEDVRAYDNGDSFYSDYPREKLGITSTVENTKALASRIPSRMNGDGRYLGFEWWNGGKQTGTRDGWIPDTGDGPEQYEYQTSDGKDSMDKFDVLWCMLRIGDKVLVEDKTKTGGIDTFGWQTYKTLADCSGDVDEYLRQTFCIGVNPKVGDKMIGQEFSIGTNFDYTTNINADEGMAIPLPYDAHLHGELQLDILGVDNGPWENYHKTRHATMFRHSSWSTDSIPLMAHVGSVVVKNFSVKFYTDGEDSESDEDIVFVSRVASGFVNKKEITGSMVHSGFSSEETNLYNLNNKIVLSTVCDREGQAVLKIKDANSDITDKPEKLYVNSMWEWLHVPRMVLTQTVTPALVSPFARYQVPPLLKTMTVMSVKMDLAEGTCKVKMTE